MRNAGAAGSSSGVGKFIGGVAVALALSAGAYVYFGVEMSPGNEDLKALVPEASGVAQQDITETPVDAPSEPTPSKIAEDAPGAIETDEPALTVEEAAATADPPHVTKNTPTIDEVRLEQDGFAVVAGRAAPGSDVEVVVDDEVIATGQADASGSFAALGVVAPSDQPRILSLRATEPEQEAVASLDEVILAPAAPPMPVDQAEQEPVQQISEIKGQEFEAASDISVKAGRDTSENAEVSARSDIAQSATAQTDQTRAQADPDAATADVVEVGAETDATKANQEVIIVAPQNPAPEVGGAEPAPDVADTSRQVALLKSDADGVTLLQSAPTPPERIVLDTIGYSDSGIVQLAGRASRDAVEVRVYLDNQAFAALPVATGGDWQGDLPDIDTGVYTLRVDAVDAAGDVTSRIETPFKREEPAILAAAAADNAGPVSSITVQTGDTLWAIARDRYGEGVLYVQVFEANRTSIRNPDLIYPGQVFDLPTD